MHRSWIIQHRASDQAMYASMLPSPPLRKSLVSGMQSSCKAVVKLLYSLPDPTKSLVAGMCCVYIFLLTRTAYPTFVPAYQLISESGCHSTPIYTYIYYIYIYTYIYLYTCILYIYICVYIYIHQTTARPSCTTVAGSTQSSG